ncbi:hypothetical protein SBA4_3480009 [Candidatus Sulfopaludibacter sp. SbA4]|nr:hypothetical protein SBA4_3480009 [Candidatus Sulfopaludibacter sp. SbA4]
MWLRVSAPALTAVFHAQSGCQGLVVVWALVRVSASFTTGLQIRLRFHFVSSFVVLLKGAFHAPSTIQAQAEGKSVAKTKVFLT